MPTPIIRCQVWNTIWTVGPVGRWHRIEALNNAVGIQSEHEAEPVGMAMLTGR